MATMAPAEIQKKRLLRMTVAHYFQEGKSEEEVYKWFTEDIVPQLVKIYSKHGLEGFTLHYSPASFRNMTRAMSAARGNRWAVRDHDFQVEFYFRDPAMVAALGADPEFRALQAAEGPYVTQVHTEASLGWVETYLQDGKVVNIGVDGKSEFLGWDAMSFVAPGPGGPGGLGGPKPQ